MIYAIAAWLAAMPVHADEHQIEGWSIQTDSDKFDGSLRVIAILSNPNAMFAVRCMRHHITLALVEVQTFKRYSPSDPFTINFRGDTFPAVETIGSALDERTIQIEVNSQIMRELQSSRSNTRCGSPQRTGSRPITYSRREAHSSQWRT